MTKSEIDKLHKSIATDFKIVTRKTELWELSYCYDVLHDVKKLMTFGYLESVSLALATTGHATLKAKKYIVGSTTRANNDRPGTIDWEDGEGQILNVILSYTPAYHGLSLDEKTTFQQDNLKAAWFRSSVDVNFPHLSKMASKMYTHETGGIDRIDFN